MSLFYRPFRSMLSVMFVSVLLLAACASLSPEWTLETSTDYATVPVESEGGLFLGAMGVANSSGLLHAIDRSGGLRWTQALARHPAQGVMVGPAGELLVVEDQGVAGLSPSDGSILWQVSGGFAWRMATNDEWVVCNRLQNGEYLVVGIRDGVEAWTSLNMGSDTTALALGLDNVTFGLTASEAFALDEGGALLWRSEVGPNPNALALDRDAVLVVRMGSPGEVLRLDRASGAVQWRTEAEVIGAPVVDDDGSLYLPTAGGILALDADGDERWQGEDSSGELALGADGRLYGWGLVDDGFGNYDFAFSVFSTADGRALWQEGQIDAVDSSNGSPNLLGGKVYYAGGTYLSGVYAFRGGPRLASTPWPRAEGGANNGRSEQ